jgi:hypothetical protein
MAQLIIINFYIRHCKQTDIPVGDTAEFQGFMVHYYGAQTFPADQPIFSDLAPTILTPDTALVGEARRRGVETPEHKEFFKQYRHHRIELAMERYNSLYLKNQKRSPVETRVSNAYYIYSQPPILEDATGKRKKARLSGRLPGTSRKQTELPARPSAPAPPSRRSSQRRDKRKKPRGDQIISYGTAVFSRTQSSVDTEREEFIPELRSAPRKPTFVSRAISVAIPITQEADDPIATPMSRRRSARINESKDSTSRVTRSLK